MVSTTKKRNNCKARTSPVIGLVSLLLGLLLPWSSVQADEWHFSDVERIVAVSDIHGAYDALVETLQVAEVIDEDLAWSGGKTHFVVTGDLLDRGPDSRLVMDLIMRLEHEAPLVGGRVHQLLGNHEVMNLIGDLRYVADEEYAAFLDMESEEDREFWYKKFRRDHRADSAEAVVRLRFDEKAPPGYFGHRRAFRHDGIYGSWLLKKPLMIVINDIAFVHGGVPPYVARYGLAGVNGSLKKKLRNFLKGRTSLEKLAILSPLDQFKEIPERLLEKSKAGQLSGSVLTTAQSVINLGDSPLYDAVGPTWYRGTATCNSLVEGDRLNAALDNVGATKVVIGHTTTITRRVQQRMNGRIVEIDTGMLKKNYEGSGNALIIENGKMSVVNQDGRSDLLPIDHPLRVGHQSIAISDDELADILATGELVATNADGVTRQLVQVTNGEMTVFANFNELAQGENFVPELAAFRLDRTLGLGMVPVTVRREVDGRPGTLQFVPAQIMTEHERVAARAGRSPACPRDIQLAAMNVFDTLVGNFARTPSSMLYNPDDWNLMLVDHGNSFGTGIDLSAFSQHIDLVIGDQWRMALIELDDQLLRELLGDALDESRLAALAKRRDALVGISTRTRK